MGGREAYIHVELEWEGGVQAGSHGTRKESITDEDQGRGRPAVDGDAYTLKLEGLKARRASAEGGRGAASDRCRDVLIDAVIVARRSCHRPLPLRQSVVELCSSVAEKKSS
jgi:hypothetical protein